MSVCLSGLSKSSFPVNFHCVLIEHPFVLDWTSFCSLFTPLSAPIPFARSARFMCDLFCKANPSQRLWRQRLRRLRLRLRRGH